MKNFFLSAVAALLLLPAYSQNSCEGDTLDPVATYFSLSSALMNSHSVQLWAIDFIKTSSDNCSPSNRLMYTFNNERPITQKLSEIHYFKGNGQPGSEYEFSIGKAQRWNPDFRSSEKTFQTCFLNGTQINLITTVWDEAFNSTSGHTQTTFIDQNPVPCHLINFHVTTVKGEGLTQFEARLEAGVSEFPRVFTGDHTLCANVPVFGTEMCAYVKKETNPNNGVGINDLILLRNHILGLKKITDPYQLIAADVNNDNKLTAADLTELKRMINGFQSSFSKTHSWIIVKKDYVFPNPQNPWLDLGWKNPEPCFSYGANDDDIHVYFLAIKSGDIDQTAKP